MHESVKEVKGMRHHKRQNHRGSLSLSVNAIVVFILAFAMLGVGLFFVNKVRGSIDIDPNSFLPANQLKNPPSSDDPLTIDNEIKMKPSEEKRLTLGFYAREKDYSELRFYIQECTNAATNKRVKRTVDPVTKVLNLAMPIACVDESTSTPSACNCGAVPCTLPEFAPVSSLNIKQGVVGGPPKILKANGALEVGGNYVCTVIAVDPNSAPTQNQVIESKGFYLTVVS